MRIDARNIHLQSLPIGLGDALSDAARARRLSLSPGLALGPQPSIVSMSANSGNAGDRISVTTDVPADGLIMLDPNLPGQTINLLYNGLPSTSINFVVPSPSEGGFPWPAGTYEIRAYATASDNFSPTGVPFTVKAFPSVPVNHPTYIPSGVTQNAQGQFSVPGVISSLVSPPSSPTNALTITTGPTGLPISPNSSSPISVSGFTLPAILTDSSFAGIPNWVLILGAVGALWFFGRKR